MAAKSDFAQKLLHDLRLRKERMAAAQSSGNSKSMSRGSCGDPGQAYKGSRQIKALESVGSRAGKSQGINIRDTTKSFKLEDSSKQLVPYGRGRSSGQVGDLSTALAYAFGNGGNLSKMDASGNIPMINFLHQMGWRSLDAGKIEISGNFGRSSSNTRVPTYFHMHISEIAKGVQKLNQILRGCSNGLNFDRYSIDVGNELLKGAMDLEESLRMLVNLQEASDYMISTQRKNKIKLLEDDEEGENESAKEIDLKQLDRPRFSFDRPFRNPQRNKGETKNGIRPQLMALTYQEENTPRWHEKQPHTESNLPFHTRSVSCVPDYRTLSTYLETKNESISSHSKAKKGRIPNVIAKLMGLEELPPKGDSKATKTELSSKRDSSMFLKKRGISVDSRPPETENIPPPIIKRSAASPERTPTRDNRLVLNTETFLATSKGSSKVVMSVANSQWQDLEIAAKTDDGSVSKTATFSMDKRQIRNKKPDEMPGKRILQEKGKEENNRRDEVKRITKTAEGKEMFLNDELQYKSPERHRISEAETESEHIAIKSNAVQTGNKNAGSLFLSKTPKHQHNHKLQRPQVVKKFERLEEKRSQQLLKQKLHARESKGEQKESIVAPKAKNSANALHKKQIGPNLSMASKKKPTKHIDEKPSKGLTNSRNDVDLSIKETSVRASQQREKANYMKINASKTQQKTEAVINRRSEHPNHSARQLITQSSVRQEMKQQNDNKIYSSGGEEKDNGTHSEKAGAEVAEFSEVEVSPQPSNAVAESHSVAEDVTFHNHGEDECQGLEVSNSVTSKDNCCAIAKEMNEAPDDCQQGGNPPVSADDIQIKSMKAILIQHGGDHDGSTEIDLASDEPKKVASPGTEDLLTELDKHLKEVLIKGQLFLNTAVALFKFDIPVSIFHLNDQNDQDAETKIILDFGYELLKKKGRRQELALYPGKGISVGLVKVKSFDDLIKQLSKDFELLRFYGGKRGGEYDAADYLYKMLEKDIQNRDPDVNSMWDFSWDDKKFAFPERNDIVRDVEKHMLNGLLDEITNDLLKIVVSAKY